MPDQLFKLSSPLRSLSNLPLSLPSASIGAPSEGAALEDTASGERFALQADGDKWRVVVPSMAQGEVRTLRLTGSGGTKVRAEIRPGQDRLDVLVDGKEVASYHTARRWARPFLWPLNGPGGVPMTRAWPMADAPEEKTDHKHHKSLWFAHGDLNGSDNWSEETASGKVEHMEFTEQVSGPVFCRFTTAERWLNAAGHEILRSSVSVTTYAMPEDERLLDFQVRFHAHNGPVRFGDTKEGGLISLRLTASMNGDRGGLIENAYGGLTETECWGKPAPWVDYSGPVEGEVLGAAIFDHPDNLCYPTRWHVRDYGLFTANPFALHDYLGRTDVDGSMTLGAGETWTFRYRLYLHRGDAAAGDVRNRYLCYVAPPVIAPVEP